MYEHFTDTENTGAPLVPRVETSADTREPPASDHEEAVLSHRIEPYSRS
jgi:hypothetical protein